MSKRQLEYALAMSDQAFIAAQANGLILQGLLNILSRQGVLSDSLVGGVFQVAAAMLDAETPEDETVRHFQKATREVIERIAEGAGIEIPPPGQTTVQRRQ